MLLWLGISLYYLQVEGDPLQVTHELARAYHQKDYLEAYYVSGLADRQKGCSWANEWELEYLQRGCFKVWSFVQELVSHRSSFEMLRWWVLSGLVLVDRQMKAFRRIKGDFVQELVDGLVLECHRSSEGAISVQEQAYHQKFVVLLDRLTVYLQI